MVGVEELAEDASTYGERHALVIGIDQYEDPAFPDLRYAVADAEGVAKILIEKFAFKQERVRLFKNHEATLEALSRALDDWAGDQKSIHENDLVVIFFAGHGLTRSLGKPGDLGYLVPVGGRRDPLGEYQWSSLISMDKMKQVSLCIPAKHVLFILDCCFGGLAAERVAPSLAAGLSRRARQLLTAGGKDETVQDSGASGHSVFTGALLEALQGEADEDGDRVITFGELFSFVGLRVEGQTSRRQTPLNSQFPDHDGGSVALFPPDVYEEILLRVRQEAYLSQVVAGLIPEGVTREPDWEEVDPDLRFRFETSTELVSRIRGLDKLIADVESRIEFASTIKKRSIDDFGKDWDEAINEVALSDKYGGLETTPQIGLVPIGPDPESGLWEFWHVETGERPERDLETQKLKIREETGLVLVLIPGGTFTMGAIRPSESHPLGSPNVDPLADSDESPLRSVTVEPFFLSKFEMTQAQWARVMGLNPSWHRPGGCSCGTPPIAPVEMVSFEDGVELCRRMGLVLPKEAEWEYAARGGTTSAWWTGNDRNSLDGAENLADIAFNKAYEEVRFFEDWLDDGFFCTAPIGTYRANGFGLHDVGGNVYEWCQDLYETSNVEANTVGEDEKQGIENQAASPQANPNAELRVVRGGGYNLTAGGARSAYRNWYAPGARGRNLGLRPARGITTE